MNCQRHKNFTGIFSFVYLILHSNLYADRADEVDFPRSPRFPRFPRYARAGAREGARAGAENRFLKILWRSVSFAPCGRIPGRFGEIRLIREIRVPGSTDFAVFSGLEISTEDYFPAKASPMKRTIIQKRRMDYPPPGGNGVGKK
jgi:hypothetical protein